MQSHTDKTQQNKSNAVANNLSKQQGGNEPSLQFANDNTKTIAQTELQQMADNSLQVKQLKAYQAMADNYTHTALQRKENNTGLPDNLKSGMENLSGYSMDDVKVHYNSDKPTQLNAHAYAQGSEIHVAPGQEKHLAHEAWHVVQQKQGRVKPTLQMKGNVPVNDDVSLETEADVMGAKVFSAPQTENVAQQKTVNENSLTPVVQGIFYDTVRSQLIASPDYLSTKIPWDAATHRGVDRELTGADPTLENLLLSADGANIRTWLQNALNLPAAITVSKKTTDAAIADMNLTVSGTGTEAKIQDAYDSSIRMAILDQYGVYNHVTKVPVSNIPRAKDLIPEVPDLGALFEPAKVCTLIALVKAEGAAAINARLGIHPASNGVQDVTRAMHTYYMGQGVQYDDTSSHVKLMDSFGWKIVYTGPCSWHYLHHAFPAMALNTNYIFDIQGHTVKVQKIAEVPKNVELTNATLDNYYAPDSEAWNFNITHYNSDVWYIYGK